MIAFIIALIIILTILSLVLSMCCDKIDKAEKDIKFIKKDIDKLLEIINTEKKNCLKEQERVNAMFHRYLK